jgi:hypothetical protein
MPQGKDLIKRVFKRYWSAVSFDATTQQRCI